MASSLSDGYYEGRRLMLPSSTIFSYGRGYCQAYQLPPPPPNSEVVQFQDNHGNLKSPFFWWLWHLGFHPFVLITQWWRGVRHGHVSCSRLTEGSQLFDFSIFPSSQIRPFLLFFSFKSYIFSLSLCFFFLLELYYLLSLPLMVGYSDIRRTSPSVAFFFARLGVFLCSFSDHYPRVRDLF